MIDPDNVDAEFAVIMRSDLKGKGLGHLLLAKMIAFLSARGTQRLLGYVLHENDGMRDLARSHGFEVDPSLSDSDALCIVLALPRPEPAARVAAD